MKIKTLTISNWRSIKHAEIQFEPMMVFIGQNNHGKSNILTALLFFFGELTCDDLDFRNGSDQLYVEVLFSDLDDMDKTTFQKYVSTDGHITVRRQANKFDSKCEYHGYIESPSEDWLKSDNASNYTTRSAIEPLPLIDYLPPAGRITKDMVTEAQAKYIAAHRDTLTFTTELETNNFLGAKGVAKGIWGDVFFVPSIKKASDELSTRTTTVFSQLYSRVLNAMSSNSAEFQDAKRQLNSLVDRLNKHTSEGSVNANRPTELTDFEEMLGRELTNWDAKIDVEITPPDVDSILKLGTTVWIDDGIRTDVSRKGQGLQRALIFGLVRALAKLSEHDQAGKDVARRASKSTYFILEEPELFLHPQAQRAVFESLQALSATSQVIMCTHSSAFLSLDWYQSICRVCKRTPDAGTDVYQCTVNLFNNADDKKRFNMVYWINPDRSELFFARKVILLEGQTDKTIIPLLAKKIGVHRHDFTLIDCASKDCMPQYIRILNYFNIPYIAVYDKDHQNNKGQEAIRTADLSSNNIEGVISTHLGGSVVFDNDIEEELGLDTHSSHKSFFALQHVNKDDFEIPSSLKAKIKRMYEEPL